MAWRCAEVGSACLTAFAGMLLADPATAEQETEERSPVSMVLFSSLEAGPAKTLATIGMKRAIGRSGLDASGFRSMLKIGISREGASGTRPHGRAYKVENQVLFGYEWRFDETFAAIYAGQDIEGAYFETWDSWLYIARIAPRIQVDLWTKPTETMMLQAGAYVSSLDRRAWVRLAAGWTIRGEIYAGPEIEAYRQRNYHQLRVGFHLTGLRLLGLSWRLSGGWQHSSNDPPQAYATLGVHWRR